MKKFLAIVLALCMVVALAACGNSAPAPAPAAEEAPAPAAEEAPAEEAPAAAGSGSLKIWVPDATKDFTEKQVASFMEAHP